MRAYFLPTPQGRKDWNGAPLRAPYEAGAGSLPAPKASHGNRGNRVASPQVKSLSSQSHRPERVGWSRPALVRGNYLLQLEEPLAVGEAIPAWDLL